MKKLLITTFLFLFLIYNHAFSQDFCNVKYLSNYDGDTIKFDLGENLPDIFRYINLRLYGIDTPEIKTKNKKKFSSESKTICKK